MVSGRTLNLNNDTNLSSFYMYGQLSKYKSLCFNQSSVYSEEYIRNCKSNIESRIHHSIS